MKIGIVVFAYNRSLHLSKTLDALRKNKGIDKIYFFQDGLKIETHREEWEKTKDVIQAVDWCKTVYFLREKNEGLRKSILDGINYVFQENDAIIVLEDDCVPTSNFMTFMRQSLKKYKDYEQVYSVSGYAWPLELKEKKTDAYFCGRISSWGWGTWKDRWNKLEINYEIIREMKSDINHSQQLAIWGNDMEDILVNNVKGITDSWAVFWGLNVIKQGGLNLTPYYSLIDNIGQDGSGVHCGDVEIEKVKMMDETIERFELPDELSIGEEVKCKFPALFNGVYHGDSNTCKPKAVIYGMGNFYKKNERIISNQYNVIMYIDKNNNGYYAGRKIGKIRDIGSIQSDIIILMILDISEAIKIARELNEKYNIPFKKIKMGQELFN